MTAVLLAFIRLMFAVMAVSCYVSAIQTLAVEHFGSCSFIDHSVANWPAEIRLYSGVAESFPAGGI